MKIKKIIKKDLKFPIWVYNFETKNQNNYFLNGLLVHNCFSYYFKSINPKVLAAGGMKTRAVNPNVLLDAIKGNPHNTREKHFYESFYKRKFLLHWGGMADPFCTFELQNKVGLKIINELGEMNYPTLFSFKGPAILTSKYLDTFEKYADQCNFAFQASIITNSDKLSKLVEIGVPSTTKRLKALKMLSDMGYWTILRLRPFILGITDEGLDELLQRALEAGIKGVSMEFFVVDTRATDHIKMRYDWIAKLTGTKDLLEYYKATSPSERGGYMRMNRDIKELQVKKVYEFCAKHNLVCAISDPDFKELCTSGSCCGMPDHFPKNPLLENWTRNQLTYHLKEKRKAFHKTGKDQFLYFNEVYGSEPYLDDPYFGNEHVILIGRPRALRKVWTQRFQIQHHWNTFNTGTNIRNYTHGKVLPCGVDDSGNLVYKYQEHEYEKRWKKEGIDLTR